MMKRMTLLAIVLLMTAASSYAQKVAVIDVDAILESQEDYRESQEQLDKISEQWRNEIQQEYDVIKSMYNKYQADQILLSDDARIKREQEIVDKEKAVRDLQRAKFGPEGELFIRRQELIRPTQEKVFKAIEAYASSRGYDLIFDKSSTSGLIYTNDSYDKTDEVMKRLAKQ